MNEKQCVRCGRTGHDSAECKWPVLPAVANVGTVAAVLACEIEAGVFEQHVVPALEVARKVAAEQAQQAEPVARDVRCECCGYMTYHREHLGCIRAAQPPAVAVAVPDGWDAESVRLAFSTLRYIIGLKPDGIKAPCDHVQDIIEKVASWSDMGPCHPVRKQYEAAAAHRAMLAAAPQAASCLPAEMTPAMMRAVQMRSELGAYAAANLSGAYDLFADFWRVAVEEAQKGVA